MTTLTEFMIIACTDNRPPMLEKSLYDSWKSRMELYIENRENMIMFLNSLQNGPLVWPTMAEEDGSTRTKKYEELSVAEKLQDDYDLKATNIILQCLPSDVVTIQQAQGSQEQSYTGTGYKGNATSSGGNNARGNAVWYKEKAMLAEAQESDQILDEEKLAFLADPGIPDDQAA
nr:hypothetical protein [Tanacetum cinerariifolium]